MRRTTPTAMAIIAASALALPALAQQMFIFPNQGQTPEQHNRDKSECHGWAVGQTGYDPMSASTQSPASGQAPQGVGAENGRGWSGVIMHDTGEMSAAIAADEAAFVLLGACTGA